MPCAAQMATNDTLRFCYGWLEKMLIPILHIWGEPAEPRMTADIGKI
jgi:hypothetical protein